MLLEPSAAAAEADRPRAGAGNGKAPAYSPTDGLDAAAAERLHRRGGDGRNFGRGLSWEPLGGGAQLAVVGIKPKL